MVNAMIFRGTVLRPQTQYTNIFWCKSYLLLEICRFIDFLRQWRVDGLSKDRQTVDSILGIGSRVWMIFVLEFCDKSIYDGCVRLYCIPHP